ncbi:MAG TPA: VWA domain-containing protein [Armatimonadota bacterium]|jgi:Ca-activated chloride channel family protein
MNSFDPDKTAGFPPPDAAGAQSLLPNPDRTQMVAPGGYSLICRPENTALLASDAAHNHLLVQWRAEGGPAASGPRMPLNLALAIDRSGSMEGEPLQYAQRACAQIIDLLEPSDILTIVTFAEDVDVLVPARRVVNRALLKEHVARITTGNTTNLHDGILAAANQVASVGAKGYVNRVLVLTDGEPTAGIRDFQSITAQAAEQRNRGVTVTALGFGPEYNEELLAGIARRSGGNYYYIARPELLPEVFRSELVSMMRLAARNAKLTIRPAKWNRVRQVYGHRLSFTPDGVEVDLADLEQGAALTLLAEMDFGPRPTGEYRCATVEVEFEDAQGGAPQRIAADAVWTFTSDPQEAEASLDAGVAAELQVALASQQLERTLMGMRTQQLDGQTAMLDLQRTQQILASSGRSTQAAEVTMALDNLRRGDANAAEKTLTGASLNLERGKTE